MIIIIVLLLLAIYYVAYKFCKAAACEEQKLQDKLFMDTYISATKE